MVQGEHSSARGEAGGQGAPQGRQSQKIQDGERPRRGHLQQAQAGHRIRRREGGLWSQLRNEAHDNGEDAQSAHEGDRERDACQKAKDSSGFEGPGQQSQDDKG